MAEPALVLVDIQAGAFGGCGIPAVDGAERLLQNAAALLEAARTSGTPVVHIQHCARPGEVFAEGAPGWPIATQVRPQPDEPVVRKHASNAFEDTTLDAVLRERGITHVVVSGLQSEHCVAATCRGAVRLGYDVKLAGDAHSTWPDGGRAATDIVDAQNAALEHDGVTLSSTEHLVGWLHACARAR